MNVIARISFGFDAARGDEMGDPVREDARLARPGAGDDQNGPFGREDGLALRRIEIREVLLRGEDGHWSIVPFDNVVAVRAAALLLALTAALCWGVGGILLKKGTGVVSPTTILFVQYLVGLVVIGGWILASGGVSAAAETASRRWPLLAGIVALQIGGYLAFVIAIQRSGPGSVSTAAVVAIAAMYPALVAVLSGPLLGQDVGWHQYLGVGAYHRGRDRQPGSLAPVVAAIFEAPLTREQAERLAELMKEGKATRPGGVLSASLLYEDGVGRLVAVWQSRDTLDRYLAVTPVPRGAELMRQVGADPSFRLAEVLELG